MINEKGKQAALEKAKTDKKSAGKERASFVLMFVMR